MDDPVPYDVREDAVTDAPTTPTGGLGPASSGSSGSPSGAGQGGSTTLTGATRPRLEQRPAAARPPAPRRARLSLKRIDPWSVFVMSLIISLFLGVVLFVAVAVLYSLLDSMGVLTSIDTFAQDLQLVSAGQSVIGKSRVLGVAAVVAAVDAVLLTVLATLFAFLYNLCASLTGGIEVTLAERD